MAALKYIAGSRNELETVLELTVKETPQSNILTNLTIEQGLYLLLVLIAAVVRLVGLDNIPLSPAEAGEALSVYQFWQPGATAVVSGRR